MSRHLTILAIAVCAAVFVDAPMLITSFVGEDALRASVDGWLAIHHATLLDAFRSALYREDFLPGRFHPGFVALTLLEMHVIHQPLPLKLAALVAVGLNVATLAFVVRELTGSAERALAAAACSVLMLQIRVVYDATTGAALHLQTTLECGLLSVGLLAYAYRNRGPLRWVAYGASLISYAAAIALYELMMPLIFALLLLSIARNRETVHRVVLSLPFIIVAAADVAALIAVRHAFPQSAGAFYAERFDGSYPSTAVYQIVSTLPFVYELIDPQSLFHASGMYGVLVTLAVVASVGCAVAWSLARRSSAGRVKTNERTNLTALATALALVLTGAIVALSPIYQHAIRLGLPYAPVYLQGFGLAIIASAYVPYRNVMAPMLARLTWATYGLAVITLFIANVVVARALAPSGYARETIVDGLVHGAGVAIGTNARVYLDQSYYWVNDNSYDGHEDVPRGPLLWDSKYFYRLWSGRTWQTRPLAREKLFAGEDAYEIRSVDNDGDHGTLIVANVRGRGGRLAPTIESATIYERGIAQGAAPVPALASAFAADDFTRIGSGAGWRLTNFRPHCDALPADALVANAPTAARLAYGDSFSAAETDGRRQWHWAGRDATLALVNETGGKLVTELDAPIETIGSARGTMTITSPSGPQRLSIDARATVVRIVVSIPPKSQVEARFRTDAPDIALPGDTRDLRFRIIDPTLRDRVGCGAADASTAGR